jgi:hypothetical protein
MPSLLTFLENEYLTRTDAMRQGGCLISSCLSHGHLYPFFLSGWACALFQCLSRLIILSANVTITPWVMAWEQGGGEGGVRSWFLRGEQAGQQRRATKDNWKMTA